VSVLELDVRTADTLAPPPSVELRPLHPGDWPAVAEIYWDGMRGGLATFETEVPTWEAWDAAHLPGHRLVADLMGDVVGWAALAPASSRPCYRGVAEDSVYVARAARGLGIGRQLLEALAAGAEAVGIWTIQTSIFPENRASLALHERCGFRVVGTRERIAKRDGVWRDTVFLERRSGVIE
jgi:L-amino acid N-acyltransferase YncA